MKRDLISSFPWWAKIIVGLGGFAILYFTFDLMNLALSFLTIVCIPLMALASIGLFSEGAYEAFASGDWLRDLKNRVSAARARLEAQDPAKAGPGGSAVAPPPPPA